LQILFLGLFDFHQIGLIQAGGDFITGTSQPGSPFAFSYALLAGNYQVNYKRMPIGWDGVIDRILSGSYLSGISIGALDAPFNPPAFPA
jgi:hypothetical protein